MEIVSSRNGIYNVKQLSLEKNDIPDSVGGQIPLSWSHGPLVVVGYVDPRSSGICVNISLMGIYLVRIES